MTRGFGSRLDALLIMPKMAKPSALPRRAVRSRVSCVIFAVVARGLCPVSSFCARSSPLAVTRARPWEERLRGGAAAVAGRAASTVVMQIQPEGGQSPCNIKASGIITGEEMCCGVCPGRRRRPTSFLALTKGHDDNSSPATSLKEAGV